MKAFIFISKEGYTYQPRSESVEPDIDNMQVLGFEHGKSPSDAFRNLLCENTWLPRTSFNEVVSLELKYPDYWKFSSSFDLKPTDDI